MKKFLCLLIALFMLSGISYAKGDKNSLPPKPTAKEIIELQTRTYNNVDTFVLMKAILNVLQDNYYFVEDADYKLGFIRANREFDTRDKYINIKEEFGCSKKMTGIKRLSVAKTEVNVNITQNEDNTNTVRLSIRKKVLNMYDIEIRVTDVVDKELYNEFFASVDKKLSKKNICNIEKKETEANNLKEKDENSKDAKKSDTSQKHSKTAKHHSYKVHK